MIHPIIIYGNEILRQKCSDVDIYSPYLPDFIADMWETLTEADGCGLAAPQIGRSLRIFIVNSYDTYKSLGKKERKDYFGNAPGIKETFINPQITEYGLDRLWAEDEGCLSIPGLSCRVVRPWSVTVRYRDVRLQERLKTFTGYTARIIQHEFDHTQGVLYTDRLNLRNRQSMKKKWDEISAGNIR